jgi:hypothetical protein
MPKSPRAINRERGRSILAILRAEFAGRDVKFQADASDPRVLEIFIERSGESPLDPRHGLHPEAVPEERNLEGYYLTEDAAAMVRRMIEVTRSVLGSDADSLFLTVGASESYLRGWANRLKDERSPPPPPPVLDGVEPSRRTKRWLSENRELFLLRYDEHPDLVEDGLALRIIRRGRNAFFWCLMLTEFGSRIKRVERKNLRIDGTRLVMETSPGRWLVAASRRAGTLGDR